MKYKYCWYCHRAIPYTYIVCPYCHAQQSNFQSIKIAKKKVEHEFWKQFFIDCFEFVVYIGAFYLTFFMFSYMILSSIILLLGLVYFFIWCPIHIRKKLKQIKNYNMINTYNERKQYLNPHHPIRNFEINTLHFHKSYHQLYKINIIISSITEIIGIISIVNLFTLNTPKICFFPSMPILSIITGFIVIGIGFFWKHYS